LKVIVPAAAGSTVDIIPRIAFDQLSRQLGQPIVAENRGGAGTTIGSALVAKSQSDGYTILVNSSAHTIAPALYPNLTYHPRRDFAAVAALGVSPSVLVVSPQRGFRSAADLVAAAKATPQRMNFSSVGVGSATHLSAERFLVSAGVQAVHVPFKGGAEAMTEVIAGRIDFFFGPVGLVLPHVKAGKLSALAVNTANRSAALPDVPTLREAGFSDADYPFWIGMFVPAKTPREIVEKLHRETLRALEEPKVRDRFVVLGVEPFTMSPSEFDDYVARAIDVDATLVRAAGLKPAN
jgi:tripartite-type tricarboxylate transporter receptor subunit TctC